MNKLVTTLLIVCSIPLTIWALDVYNDRQIKVLIEAPTQLYSSEFDAAYADCINCKHPKPLLELNSDIELTVKRTTYGKDYWALQVETKDGVSGWVISGQNGVKIINP
ncbi:hypothetical protein ACFL48_02705 [Pseudomonadota bacterium]